LEAPEAGLEPATRSLSAPGEPTSNGAVEATTGPEVPPSSGQPANSRPRNRHRASGARDLWRRRSVRDTERRGAVSKLGAAMPGRSLFSQVSAPSYTMWTTTGAEATAGFAGRPKENTLEAGLESERTISR